MADDFNNPGGVPEDKLHPGLMVLSFCIPLAGAIIYFVKREKEPNSAKTACYAALAGFALGIIIQVVMTVMSKGAM